MENTKTNFSSLRKWVKKSKEEDIQHELEMKEFRDKPIKVSLSEKILAYSIVLVVFGFIALLMIR